MADEERTQTSTEDVEGDDGPEERGGRGGGDVLKIERKYKHGGVRVKTGISMSTRGTKAGILSCTHGRRLPPATGV